MPNTGTVQIPAAVNNFYDKNLLKEAKPLLVHCQFGQVRDLPKGQSTVIKFRRYARLAASTTPLSEGVTPTGTALTYTDVTATIAQYGDFITLTDFLQMSTLDPVLTETSELLGEQAGNTLDQICRDVLVAGSSVQYAGAAVSRPTITASMKISKAEIKEAVRTLKGNDTAKLTKMVNPSDGFNTSPINACFVGIVTEDTEFDLKECEGWVPVEEYASQGTTMMGEIGKVDEVRFIMTTNGKIFAGEGASGIDVHATLIMGANFYGTSRISGEAMENIITPLGSAGSADPLKQRSTSGWKATFVPIRLNENFCVRLEHAVSP